MNYEEAKKEYQALQEIPDKVTSQWYRDRGKKLETIINALLENENLEPRTSFRPEGEEIDGSFFAFNKFFLLEMKWHKNEMPASAIYSFKGKVDGKLSGTIGIFISMSGYSKDAVDALCLGKELNIILFDKEDIEDAFNTSFSNVLKQKLRAAADYGDVYKSKELPIISKKTIAAEDSGSTLKDSDISDLPSNNMSYCILCEGRFELTVLQELLIRLMTQYFITNKIRIKQTGGHYNLLNATKDCENYDKVIIVTEVDDPVIIECKKRDNVEIIHIPNGIEKDLLGINNKFENTQVNSKLWKKIHEAVNNVNIEDIKEKCLQQLLELIK
jgi:hypothetical protein